MSLAFRTRATQALARERVRGNIRRAMDGLVQKRRAAFPDADELERLRDQGQAIRNQSLAQLPELLEQLEARCIENGIQVHWAEDADAANRLIIDLLKQRDADALLKGKSMVSEEVGLNRALEGQGIEPVETDLGELIIQLAGDHPSHIVAPAVHKDRHEVAELFAARIPGAAPVASRDDPGERPFQGSGGDSGVDQTPVSASGAMPSGEREIDPIRSAGTGASAEPASKSTPEAGSGVDGSSAQQARLAEIERLTAQARALMRQRFRQVRAGLSGVNFAVAETGTLCLVENEGNGRMSTTAPDLHIAIMGIEKVVARLDQLAPLLTLLTRSATGQPITTYVNLISGPRRAGELDGPGEVHLVLLDNGRSSIHADPELRATLRCIRCGACMNHCPVYTRIGGHGYGTVYPGPIGAILEPQLQGLERCGELAEASSLCGACAEVCPVRIPIPSLLSRLRYERAEGLARPSSDRFHRDGPRGDPFGADRRAGRRLDLQRLIWSSWAFVYRSPARYRLLQGAITRLLRPFSRHLPLGAWTRTRTAPAVARRSLHVLARLEGFSDSRS